MKATSCPKCSGRKFEGSGYLLSCKNCGAITVTPKQTNKARSYKRQTLAERKQRQRIAAAVQEAFNIFTGFYKTNTTD